jgi:branched-chain amino acid transport system substrate-binding protein
MKLALAAAAAALTVAATALAATPGVDSGTILLGTTAPLSGPETAYEPVVRGAQAYFDYVNAHGAVFGRKVKLLIEDDGYDPARTVQATRKLVEQDGVLAMFDTVGTEQALAVRPYLNQVGVPQVFVASGAVAIASDTKRYPWTVPFLPSFVGEGAIYGRDIAAKRPRAKIAVLYENSEYGDELLQGLKRGLGKKAGQIAATATYEVTDVDLSSQVQSLRASGADTLVLFALPKQAVQAFVSVAKLGWSPAEYVSGVAIDPVVMQIARLSAGPKTGEGAVSSAYLFDPTNPANAKLAGVKLYRSIMKRYLPKGDPGAVAHLYGMAAAYVMVDTLKRAGKNLTRASLLRAATHLKLASNPFMLPDIKLETTPGNVFPIRTAHLVRFHAGYWRVQKQLLRTGD